MEWIYISPHLDDVALSVGGLLWEQNRAGQAVSIWTICAGNPPPGPFSPFAESLHDRWGTDHSAMVERRLEDIASCRRLGAAYYHFDIPDCIYRRSPISGDFLYDSEDALWIDVHPDEEHLIDKISIKLRSRLSNNVIVVCPLTIGNHVDHRLTRQAAEAAIQAEDQNEQITLYYYADYPYVLDVGIPISKENLKSDLYTISEEGMLAWQEAVAHHQSQISTFWKNIDEMNSAIRTYYDKMDGLWLGKCKN